MIKINKNEAHIWYYYPDKLTEADKIESLQYILSDEEFKRLQRYQYEKDRHNFLISHGLVRLCLSQYCGINAGEWVFKKNDHGRPEISRPEEFSSIKFNLTHTDGLSACIITDEINAGIDAENTGRQTNLHIADRFFSEDEKKELMKLPEYEKKSRFYEYWTLKEAFIKAKGRGLSLPLNKFSFKLEKGKEPIIKINSDLDDNPKHWMFYTGLISEVYQLSAAIKSSEENINIIIKEFII